MPVEVASPHHHAYVHEVKRRQIMWHAVVWWPHGLHHVVVMGPYDTSLRTRDSRLHRSGLSAAPVLLIPFSGHLLCVTVRMGDRVYTRPLECS